MKTVPMTEELYEYVLKHNFCAHPILEKVERETAQQPGAVMQIAKDQGSFMHMLVHLIGARRVVEIGCFTGYSALSMASALPEGGQLFSFDIDAELIAQAKGYAEEAGLAQKITFRNQDGQSGLKELIQEHGKQSFDLAFLDADKEGMAEYFDLCCELIRPNGLIIADNVIWGGSVLDQNDTRSATQAIRAFNEQVKNDPRVEGTMLHISDGLYLLRRLP